MGNVMHVLNRSVKIADTPIVTLADALDLAAESDYGIRFYSPKGELEHDLSYRELRSRATDTARKLAAMGFISGQRLGLVAETHPFFLTFFYACQYMGLVPCPLPMAAHPRGRDARDTPR